ncbi:MAG: DUF2065 domain-containing protein [Legionellales bacterium]|nr:DUF2065 domain-containing protein [Legionellales bacterium]|tara:strand:- start:618 stop:824 length:207 start_codon:yes stop_codon:yes gene_type:complete
MVIDGWGLFWMLCSLILIVEGLMPSIHPTLWQKWLLAMTRMNPQSIRCFGVCLMGLGAVMMAVVHQIY